MYSLAPRSVFLENFILSFKIDEKLLENLKKINKQNISENFFIRHRNIRAPTSHWNLRDPKIRPAFCEVSKNRYYFNFYFFFRFFFFADKTKIIRGSSFFSRSFFALFFFRLFAWTCCLSITSVIVVAHDPPPAFFGLHLLDFRDRRRSSDSRTWPTTSR